MKEPMQNELALCCFSLISAPLPLNFHLLQRRLHLVTSSCATLALPAAKIDATDMCVFSSIIQAAAIHSIMQHPCFSADACTALGSVALSDKASSTFSTATGVFSLFASFPFSSSFAARPSAVAYFLVQDIAVSLYLSISLVYNACDKGKAKQCKCKCRRREM